MFVKFTNAKPFVGEAVIRLIGLPTKVTTTEWKLTKDTKELAFPIKVEPTAPAGIHKNLFCQVVVTENGEPVVHNLGGSELRVDVRCRRRRTLHRRRYWPNRPRPPRRQCRPRAAPPKRLTRLEQLRLEQEERERPQGRNSPAENGPRRTEISPASRLRCYESRNRPSCLFIARGEFGIPWR